jgi:hypothetical protein
MNDSPSYFTNERGRTDRAGQHSRRPRLPVQEFARQVELSIGRKGGTFRRGVRAAKTSEHSAGFAQRSAFLRWNGRSKSAT